jgi:antitoxin HicB
VPACAAEAVDALMQYAEHLDLPKYPVSLRIEWLDEEVYLATCDSLKGQVAQGRTIAKTVETAQDVARKLIEMHTEHGVPLPKVRRSRAKKR